MDDKELPELAATPSARTHKRNGVIIDGPFRLYKNLSFVVSSDAEEERQEAIAEQQNGGGNVD